MLTVALFSHSRYLCGAERMLLNLAILLERTKTVRPVLLVPGEGELVCESRRLGLAHQIVPAPPWYLVPPSDMNDYCRGVTACSETLKEILVDLNSDAVLVNTMTNVPAMLAAVALDIPSLLWVHGVIDSLLLPGRAAEFAVPHDELLLHSATRVIALSNYTSDFCTRIMRRTRLDVIHNWTPVDPQLTASPDKYHSRRLACLNTFDPHKGYATLLQAAALLKAKDIGFELHLYGDGGVRGEMENRATKMGLQDCVRFQGRTTDVQAVYDRSLAVVNPAQVEPFGMTLIEAMARKTPVVATRSGGPADIVVDGQSGFLVDRGDAAALAARMQALLGSPELAQRLGEGGFQRVCKHFNEETARAAFLPVIEGAVHDFHGYEPAVKTLAKMYRLWLDEAARGSAPSMSASFSPASFLQMAARLAKGGIRRGLRLFHRLLDRHDLRNSLPPGYEQLKDDSRIFQGDLRGFYLQSSVNLQRVGGLAYPLVLPRRGLNGLLLAPLADVRPARGSLRMEIRLPSGELAVRASLPAAGLDGNRTVRLEFEPLNACGQPCCLGIFADNVDVPLHVLEWRKYRYWGLGRTQTRAFCALLFSNET